MRMEGMKMGINGNENDMKSRLGVEEGVMIYPSRGNEVTILYTKFTNPNTYAWERFPLIGLINHEPNDLQTLLIDGRID